RNGAPKQLHSDMCLLSLDNIYLRSFSIEPPRRFTVHVYLKRMSEMSAGVAHLLYSFGLTLTRFLNTSEK
ncbi:hypothetical protein, partial [Aeromonas caviae]|uniref:hypothetical protein n=1 Tax=Aeromonas caviae TaxID=648 RepID=UPI001FB8B536